MGRRGPASQLRLPVCSNRFDAVKIELDSGARHGKFAEKGEDFTYRARVGVEGRPFHPERIEAGVVMLDDDLVDVSADRVPDTWRRPATSGFFLVEPFGELVD